MGCNHRTAFLVAVTVILFAGILVGEWYTYGADHSRSAGAEWSAGSVSFSVTSPGSDEYRAVLMDAGVGAPVEKLYIYVDPDYDSYYSQVCALYVDGAHYAEQIEIALKERKFDAVKIIGPEELSQVIAGPSAGVGVLILSYSLPSTVYSGNASDPLFSWINAGGYLYWVASEVGKYFTDSDGLHAVENNQELFFGKNGVLNVGTEYKDFYSEDIAPGGFTEALCLRNGNTMFGLNTEGLIGIRAGIIMNGFASVSIVEHGSGAIGVFGGSLVISEVDNMAQVIASGLTPYTTIISTEQGKVVRGTETGTMTFSAVNPVLYIYTGGTILNFGERFHE